MIRRSTVSGAPQPLTEPFTSALERVSCGWEAYENCQLASMMLCYQRLFEVTTDWRDDPCSGRLGKRSRPMNRPQGGTLTPFNSFNPAAHNGNLFSVLRFSTRACLSTLSNFAIVLCYIFSVPDVNKYYLRCWYLVVVFSK